MGKGFNLVQTHAYFVNGKKFYAAIWNPGTPKNFVARERSPEEFRQLFSLQYNKGYRLIHMQPYYQEGKLLYDAIWMPGTYGQYISWGKYNQWIDAENIVSRSKNLQPFLFCMY